MKHIPYGKNLKEFARDLRKRSTLSEVLLWQQLKQGQIMGYKFNRQKPKDKYIVDFYCRALNLVIEIDGSSHDNSGIQLNDIERQKILESMGLSFLRFDDLEVKKDIIKVVRTIEDFILISKIKSSAR